MEVSDYLLERITEHWMHDIMQCCGELSAEDLKLSRSTEAVVLVPPAAPALVVADDAEQVGDTEEPMAPDEETYAAMRWSSGLQDDGIVLGLIRSLPPAIVAEQVHAYRNRKTTCNRGCLPTRSSSRWHQRWLSRSNVGSQTL